MFLHRSPDLEKTEELWKKLHVQETTTSSKEVQSCATTNQFMKLQFPSLSNKHTMCIIMHDLSIHTHTCTGTVTTRKRRCGKCPGCIATDCGVCIYCKDMRKFGGSGRKKKGCEQRRCVFLSTKEVLLDTCICHTCTCTLYMYMAKHIL